MFIGKRSYLIGNLILTLIIVFSFTSGVYYDAQAQQKVLEYRDIAVIVSGSFIIATLNTKINADLYQAKPDFDIKNLKTTKK